MGPKVKTERARTTFAILSSFRLAHSLGCTERSRRSRCTDVSAFIIDELTGKEIIPTMRGKS
jgi:hypothetical protein